MKIIVTGGLGFIGSHFVRYLLGKAEQDSEIYNIDSQSYGSNPANLEGYDNDSRYCYVKDDINNINNLKLPDIDIIVNVAAETHVDRSISDPRRFIHSNYEGTSQLLEYARKNDVKKFIQVSTDEVYGDTTGDRNSLETDPLNPSNPYSASKAAADLLVKSYCRTYRLDASITRCSNNFGPNQFPEKLIPKTIISILTGRPISIYGNGKQVRNWIYVEDHVRAIYTVLISGKKDEVYNISTSDYFTNIDLVEKIRCLVKERTGKEALIRSVEDRPGHDKRYSIDSTKIQKELGWKPSTQFDTALTQTIDWYINNTSWWESLADSYSMHPTPWKATK